MVVYLNMETTTKYELKNIKILGYSTDFNKCECCGRENLKGTVSILDLNSDVILHFGTGCAVSSDKYDSLDALAQVKKGINSAKNDIKESTKFVYGVIRKLKIDFEKSQSIITDYLKFREVQENRIKRYNWEQWT